MAVKNDEVRMGEYFLTAERELRRVAPDREGDLRVWFQAKNAAIPDQPFLFGHTQDGPPTLETFAGQCQRRLSWAEVDALRAERAASR